MEEKVLAKIVIDEHGDVAVYFGEDTAIAPSKKLIEELFILLNETSEGRAIRKEIEAAYNFDELMKE